jgi:hypothetical protein
MICTHKSSFSPVGESLSVACPTESNQRRGHPAITALRLPCVAQQNKPVTKLNLSAHKQRELLRDSDSRSLYSYFVSATQRDGMGFISPNSQRRNWDDKNSNSFLFSPQTLALTWFPGPYLPRRVAQAK